MFEPPPSAEPTRLKNHRIGQAIQMTVDTSQGGTGPLEIDVKGVFTGVTPKVQTTLLGPNNHLVKIIPSTSDEYKFTVRWSGQAVDGSPFLVKFLEASEPHRIRVHGLAAGGVYSVDEPIEFNIAAQEAGRGEIVVRAAGPTRGDKQSRVFLDDNGDGTFRARYVPTAAGSHEIVVTWDGTAVPGSPFAVRVFDSGANAAARVTIRGPALTVGRVFEIGKPIELLVNTALAGPGRIVAKATSVRKGHDMKVDLAKTGPNAYLLRMTTPHADVYRLAVFYDEAHVPGSPFTVNFSKPPDATECRVRDDDFRVPVHVGKPFLLHVDAIDAGTGDLVVRASGPTPRGSAPAQLNIDDKEDNTYVITYVPTAPGSHRLHVFWSETPIPGSPFQIDVKGNDVLEMKPDPSRCRAEGPGLRNIHVGELASFRVNIAGAGAGELTVSAIGEQSDGIVHVKRRDAETYNVEYRALTPGAYLLNVRWDKRHVPGSPFKITAAHENPSSACRLAGKSIPNGIVGKPIEFVVHTKEAGFGTLTVKAYGVEETITGYVVDEDDGRLTARVDPPRPGKYKIGVYWDRRHIPGSPFLVVVRGAPDASKVRARGPGLESGQQIGDPGVFEITTEAAGMGNLDVRVIGPKGGFKADLQPSNDDEKKVTYIAKYNPSVAGKYEIEIDFDYKPIPGSPFVVDVVA